MSETSAVSVLVLSDSAPGKTSALAEHLLQSGLHSLEAQVADEDGLRHSSQVGVASGVLGSLIELLSLFSGLGLLDVQISAHVFDSVVGHSLVHSLLVVELHEAQSFGSAGVSVGEKIDTGGLGESVEEVQNILLRSIVRKSRHSDLVLAGSLELFRLFSAGLLD